MRKKLWHLPRLLDFHNYERIWWWSRIHLSRDGFILDLIYVPWQFTHSFDVPILSAWSSGWSSSEPSIGLHCKLQFILGRAFMYVSHHILTLIYSWNSWNRQVQCILSTWQVVSYMKLHVLDCLLKIQYTYILIEWKLYNRWEPAPMKKNLGGCLVVASELDADLGVPLGSVFVNFGLHTHLMCPLFR